MKIPKTRPPGVAILMVIAVLAALMAISAPFVFSMIQHERSARNDTSQQKAREGAEGSMAHGLTHLLRNTRTDFIDTSPEVTTSQQLAVNMTFSLPEGSAQRFGIDFNVQNPRGQIWSAHIEDEQGKLNVNSAPPPMLGNLLASGLLQESVEAGATVLQVDDATLFNRSGGVISMIGEPEPLPYSAATAGSTGGSIALDKGPVYAHIKGELVYDGRAQLLANGVYKNKSKKFTPYRSIYEIKTADGLTGPAALTPEAFARMERSITVENGLGQALWNRGGRMGDGVTGLDAIQRNGITGYRAFKMASVQGFSPGTVVRTEAGGVGIDYQRVRETKIEADGTGTVLLEDYLFMSIDENAATNAPQQPAKSATPKTSPKSGTPAAQKTPDDPNEDVTSGDTALANGNVYVESQMKHPVNVNTASDEVLIAVFTGVCMRGHNEAISRRTAETLANYLRGRDRTSDNNGDRRPVYATQEDLRKRLFRACDANIILPAQRDALIINSSEPNSPKLRLSTVPFCFFSHGNFTVEASAIANSDTGLQLARHTMRQQFSLPTASPGRFMAQYQEGFQNLLDQGLADRVVTFPTPMGSRRFIKDAPLNRYAKWDIGNVRLAVGEEGSMKGRSSINNDEWFEKCDDEKDAAYFQEGFKMNKRQPWVLPPSSFRNYDAAETPPTAMSFWFRPNAGSQCVFFDEGVDAERNRTTFSYDPGSGLSIKIWDSAATHRTRKPVEFVYPVTLNPGDWYHIAGSWKTSHPGGQEIRVDAKPYPEKDPTLLQFKPGGRLAQPLDLGVDEFNGTVTLQDGDGEDFPPAGALKIGEEIIEYTGHGGNSFTGCYRGARMSAAAKHKEGEWVIPFGYVNNTAEELVVGKGTLAENLDTQQNTSKAKVQLPVNANPNFVLDSETQKIPCDDLSDYPPSGFVLINGECIYYGAKARVQSGWALQKLMRAQGSAGVTAPARNLRNGAGVVLCSFQINNSAEYDPKGIVQIDDDRNNKKVEWLYHEDKQIIDGKHYLLAHLWRIPGAITYQAGNPAQTRNGPSVGFAPDDRGFRYCFGIGTNRYLYLGASPANTSTANISQKGSSHTKGEKVIPVIRMQAPHCGGYDASLNHDSPYGENGTSEVTVVERGYRDGDLRWIKQAYMHQRAEWSYIGPNGGCPARFNDWSFHFYVGLNDFVSRRYPAGATRYLRWPTGELPDALGAKRHVMADGNGEGKVNGDVDEIQINTLNSKGGRIAMTLEGTGIDTGDEQIYIEEFNAWPSPNGSSNNNVGGGSRQPGVIVQQNNSGNNQNAGASSALKWPTTGGLVRIEDELIYYTHLGDNNIVYYADVWQQLKDKPEERNKADRRWINPCTKEHELHPKIVTKRVMRLSGVQRGVLGTKPKDHPVGAQAMLLDAMPVTHLTGPYNAAADSFSVADGAGFAKEGYAWIDNEVVSWKKNNNGSFSGTEYLRGRFGTSAEDHELGSIVRALPFRYWDRNVTEYDGSGLAFVQSGYFANNARWFGVDLELMGTEDQPTRPSNIIPHLLVRFNGSPGWDAIPTNAEGGLYEFVGMKTSKGVRFKGSEGNNIRADQMEVRVFWQYLPGAFKQGFAADWKRTFSIERMRGLYTSPLIMRRLDEIEKR